jgi:hypothetical protein
MAAKIGKQAQITAAHLTNRRLALQHDILQWSQVQAVYMPAVAIARSTGDFSFEEDPSTTITATSDSAEGTSTEGTHTSVTVRL